MRCCWSGCLAPGPDISVVEVRWKKCKNGNIFGGIAGFLIPFRRKRSQVAGRPSGPPPKGHTQCEALATAHERPGAARRLSRVYHIPEMQPRRTANDDENCRQDEQNHGHRHEGGQTIGALFQTNERIASNLGGHHAQRFREGRAIAVFGGQQPAGRSLTAKKDPAARMPLGRKLASTAGEPYEAKAINANVE